MLFDAGDLFTEGMPSKIKTILALLPMKTNAKKLRLTTAKAKPKPKDCTRRKNTPPTSDGVTCDELVLREALTSFGSRDKKKQKRPIAIDLFCGAGGMSLGIEMAGFDIALAVDYDGYHVATHERNFPYGRVKCASVQDLDGKTIRQLSDCTDDIDLVFGGPPCQGFSNMGLRDTYDPRNNLLFHFARLVDELHPKAFIMENVTGLNMGATRDVFDAFLDKVSSRYNVTLPVQVLNAVDFGVPQARKRLFVIGIRKEIGQTASYPTPSQRSKATSVIEAIDDLPRVEADENLFICDSAPYFQKPDEKNNYALIARGLSRSKNDFSHNRQGNTAVCTGCQRVKHTESALELYRSTAPGETVPGHKLPRLHPDGICPTLRAGATSERGSHTAPRPIHPIVARVITAREAARLHGYPDWFSFYPAKMHAYRQIGNSVCPPVAHAVGLEVMRALSIDPKSLPRLSIKLNNTFNLPNERPTQHARIPVKVEYPKIINYLWDKAFDIQANKMIRAIFGPDDIREAIAATGANLPRVRPERFLYEAAQQRAIKHILAKPLAAGYSVAIIEKNGGVGQFQRSDAPNSLGLPKGIVINSADLNKAERIADRSFDLNSNHDLFAFVERDEFATKLSRGRWKSVEIMKDMFGEPESNPPRAKITLQDKSIRHAQVQFFDVSNVPFDRINKNLDEHGGTLALILMRLTNHHFAAVAVLKSGGICSEDFRLIFSNTPNRVVKKDLLNHE